MAGRFSSTLVLLVASFTTCAMGCGQSSPSARGTQSTPPAAEAAAPATPAPEAEETHARRVCPGVLMQDVAFDSVWPDCPLYYPVITWGGSCESPRCMRPCRISESTGPDDPPIRTEELTYDAEGRVTRVEIEFMGSSATKEIEYGPAGRPVLWRLGPDEVRYTYDGRGRLASSVTTAGGDSVSTRSITYGPHGPAVLERTDGEEVLSRVAFTYGEDGNLLRHEHYDRHRMRDASLPGDGLTQTVYYQYQQRDRLMALEGPRGARRFTYDDAGRVTRVSRGGHTHVLFEYDANGRLVVEDARAIDREGYVTYEYACEPTEAESG